jgi:Histidine kinase-, DNA gyrase B-, and HSP90-like ATPase
MVAVSTKARSSSRLGMSRTVWIAVAVFVVPIGAILGFMGPIRALQVVVTLLIPAGIVIWFWLDARKRIVQAASVPEPQTRVSPLVERARTELLATVSHELIAHPERCSLRAEMLAVAVDYRHMRDDLKVAVPDIVMQTDPNLLRFLLHVLVGNAVEHGGPRIAIWADVGGGSVRIAVSDDGDGVSPEIEDRLLDKLVDLAPARDRSEPQASSLAIARTIGEVLGGSLSYRRDPNWTHFSIRLPIGPESVVESLESPSMEVGVN